MPRREAHVFVSGDDTLFRGAVCGLPEALGECPGAKPMSSFRGTIRYSVERFVACLRRRGLGESRRFARCCRRRRRCRSASRRCRRRRRGLGESRRFARCCRRRRRCRSASRRCRRRRRWLTPRLELGDQQPSLSHPAERGGDRTTTQPWLTPRLELGDQQPSLSHPAERGGDRTTTQPWLTRVSWRYTPLGIIGLHLFVPLLLSG